MFFEFEKIKQLKLNKKDLTKEQFCNYQKIYIEIERNSLSKVSSCLRTEIDLNLFGFCPYLDHTILQHAITRFKQLQLCNTDEPDFRIIELLLIEGASPYQKDASGRDAFAYAADYATLPLGEEHIRKLTLALHKRLEHPYRMITSDNIKAIGKALTRNPKSALNKLCDDNLRNIVSFLFVDQAKNDIMEKQLAKRYQPVKSKFNFFHAAKSYVTAKCSSLKI